MMSVSSVAALEVEVPVSGFLRSLVSGIRRGKRSPDGNGTEEYDPHRREYSQDPHYGPLLSRMDAYFAGLGVEGRGCRERVACEASARPERFRPVSDLLVKPLR